VIQFFNSGGFGCQVGTEDGYAPNDPDHNCGPHASDYNPRDWQISLSELLRVIQFFNSGGYHALCGTEDGFGVGLGPDQPCSGESEGEAGQATVVVENRSDVSSLPPSEPIRGA
jgi:hypothetical protein